jgi:hypothetical protein
MRVLSAVYQIPGAGLVFCPAGGGFGLINHFFLGG